ncbi:MAG: hypothetical protein LXA50_19875 [Betaproteobacteria bacterium]|jgi:hypothetical protein|nr:hypothetical protein [Betaproteobacteria bacterium]
MILPQRAMSSMTTFCSCSGVLVSTSSPVSAMRLRMSGSFITRFSVWLSQVTIGRGRAAGPKMPYQVSYSYFGTPASAMVGISGKAGERLRPDMPSGRSLPARRCPDAAGSVAIIICTWPPMVSASAGPAPL